LIGQIKPAQGPLIGTSSSENIQAKNNIEIFPNPFTDRINFKMENINSKKLQFDLYSVDGKKVYSREIPGGSTYIVLDLSELKGRGSYFYQMKDGEEYYRGILMRVE